MKWSIKDVLLVVGIMVAAIITIAAIVFKDDLTHFSSKGNSLVPKKVVAAPFSGLWKVKKALFRLPVNS